MGPEVQLEGEAFRQGLLTLEAQMHLHAKDETVQLPPGTEKRKEVRKEQKVQSLGLLPPG